MKPALAEACLIFFYLAVPALLVIRYSWPRVLPRWAVLASVAGLGGTAFYLHEYLHRAHMLDVAERMTLFPHPAPIFVGPMTSLQGPRSGDFLVAPFRDCRICSSGSCRMASFESSKTVH